MPAIDQAVAGPGYTLTLFRACSLLFSPPCSLIAARIAPLSTDLRSRSGMDRVTKRQAELGSPQPKPRQLAPLDGQMIERPPWETSKLAACKDAARLPLYDVPVAVKDGSN